MWPSFAAPLKRTCSIPFNTSLHCCANSVLITVTWAAVSITATVEKPCISIGIVMLSPPTFLFTTTSPRLSPYLSAKVAFYPYFPVGQIEDSGSDLGQLTEPRLFSIFSLEWRWRSTNCWALWTISSWAFSAEMCRRLTCITQPWGCAWGCVLSWTYSSSTRFPAFSTVLRPNILTLLVLSSDNEFLYHELGFLHHSLGLGIGPNVKVLMTGFQKWLMID